MGAKVVFGWGFNSVGPTRPGISEVHYYMNAVTDTEDVQLVADAAALMNARTQLMGANVRATIVRMSLPGVRNSCNTLYPGQTQPNPSQFATLPAISQGNSDLPSTSVRIYLKTLLGQRSICYMAGLPDVFIKTGDPNGPDFGAVGLNGYQALWNQYITLLLGGKWGSKFLDVVPPQQPVPIAFWVQSIDAPFNLRFVLPNTSPYSPAPQAIVHIRGTLMGVTGVPRPIGNWRIRSTGSYNTDHTFYELDQSSAYQAVLVQEPGTVEQVTHSLVPYARQTALLQGSHRRGVGPVRSRGRSRPRVRRQPV